jgi:hypothetical protein
MSDKNPVENQNTCSVRVPDTQEQEKFKAEYCEGRRVSFTVIVEEESKKPELHPPYEQRYDADRLEATFRDGDMEPMLSFVSSGRRIIVQASKVKSVEFQKPTPYYGDGRKLWNGAHWCAGCDGPLKHLVKRPS